MRWGLIVIVMSYALAGSMSAARSEACPPGHWFPNPTPHCDAGPWGDYKAWPDDASSSANKRQLVGQPAKPDKQQKGWQD
jgi:hypothetical protein